MKRLFLLLFVLCLGVSADAQAVIKFDKTVHNFGTFKESELQKCTFEFTNTGDEPLTIMQAHAACGCTVPKFSKDPIAPGGKGKIFVTYNGKGKVGGHFRKVVTVRSSASNSLARIYVEGIMEIED
ncbi:MAG: DUF1573 domain-containing protein [Alloprevotella sp.]